MPNRIIKDSIRTSKSVNAMTDFQFRLWVYLITYVDDYGRGSADPELLKGFVFPRRKRVSESDIEKALAELAGMGCILLYVVDGESYFCFPRWSDHQRIQTKKSKFPGPDEATEIHGESRWKTEVCCDAPPESESESKSESNPKKKHSPSQKQAYGEFDNVLLADAELEKLKELYPKDYQAKIDRLSTYMASSGKTYKNHYATIRNWSKDEKPAAASAAPGSLEYEAMQRMMQGGGGE